jgi:hypothetical protein
MFAATCKLLHDAVSFQPRFSQGSAKAQGSIKVVLHCPATAIPKDSSFLRVAFHRPLGVLIVLSSSDPLSVKWYLIFNFISWKLNVSDLKIIRSIL